MGTPVKFVWIGDGRVLGAVRQISAVDKPLDHIRRIFCLERGRVDDLVPFGCELLIVDLNPTDACLSGNERLDRKSVV